MPIKFEKKINLVGWMYVLYLEKETILKKQ